MQELKVRIEPEQDRQHAAGKPGGDMIDRPSVVEEPDNRGFLLSVTGSEFLAYGEMVLR